jgi:hypothetical protein
LAGITIRGRLILVDSKLSLFDDKFKSQVDVAR